MEKNRGTIRAALGAALLAAAGSALAAGGHHAVDNAEILEPQQCELEGWFTRALAGERLLHAGGNCRVGPLELGAASEYLRAAGGSLTAWGLEAKWATEVAEGFSIGAKAGPVWAAHLRPRYQGATAVALATWRPAEAFALHLNLGREFVNDGEDENRYGAGVEWTPAARWTLAAERYKELDSHLVRAAVRFAGGEDWSLDLSRSHRLSGSIPSTWTLGATWQFDRR